MSKPQDIFPSIQWTPWQLIDFPYIAAKLPHLFDDHVLDEAMKDWPDDFKKSFQQLKFRHHFDGNSEEKAIREAYRLTLEAMHREVIPFDNFRERILLLLNCDENKKINVHIKETHKDEEPIESYRMEPVSPLIFNDIERNVAGYLQCKHLWTKAFIKKANEKFLPLLDLCSNLDQNIHSIFQDDGLLKLIQDQLLGLDKKEEHPFGSSNYIPSGEFIELFSSYLYDFRKIINRIVQNIKSHFPETIQGNDMGSEKELLKILIYELIYIFEKYFDPELQSSGEKFSDKEIREHRLFFVGTILFQYGIQSDHTKRLADIPENKNKTYLASSNDRLARIIDEAFNQYQTNLKTPKK